MSNERIRGVQVYRPIIYGSHARLLSDAEKELAPAGHTHRWTVFLTSATSPPPDAPTSSTDAPPAVDMDYLPGGADDLSYLIKKVTFRLHETYTNPARVFDKPPFKVTETGWGEFVVTIRVQFVPESGEKPMTLSHPIKLHHWGVPVEAPPAPPPAAEVPDSQAPSEAEAGPTDSAAATPSAVPTPSTPAPPPTAAPPADAVPTPPVEGELNMDATPVPVTDTTAETPSAPAPAPVAPAPISTAALYPVHSWQYDELVFSDPPSTFLNLMNEHTPTPLPPRNRRARDQREEHDVRKGKKGKKADKAAVAAGENLSALTSGENPGTGLAALSVGIPGEPGSADVPLEFSQEMEKGEWNRLNEARIRIVEEMDNWRYRLIAQEKELARVKGEMKAMS